MCLDSNELIRKIKKEKNLYRYQQIENSIIPPLSFVYFCFMGISPSILIVLLTREYSYRSWYFLIIFSSAILTCVNLTIAVKLFDKVDYFKRKSQEQNSLNAYFSALNKYLYLLKKARNKKLTTLEYAVLREGLSQTLNFDIKEAVNIKCEYESIM